MRDSAPTDASSRRARTRRWLGLALVPVGFYLLIVACVGLFQRRFIYHPQTVSPENARKAAATGGFKEWNRADGQIIGWKRSSRLNPAWGQVLVLHGNAGWAMHRRGYADALQGLAAVEVYLLEYPGYGPRAGRPSQEAFFHAATEGFQALATNLPVFLIGESLGTGPACFLAGTQPQRVTGLLLIAPFANLTDLGQRHMPLMPVRWLLIDRFPSSEYLQDYRGPVAVWLAGHDIVVPKRFGRALFDAYRGPKQLWEFPQAGHNNLPLRRETDWEQVIEFWQRPRRGPMHQ